MRLLDRSPRRTTASELLAALAQAEGHVKGRGRGGRRYDVAFYVPWIGPLLTGSARSTTGGAETQIFLLARALADRGSKVCLVVFELPGTTIPSSLDGVAVSLRPPYQAHEPFGKLRETVSLRKAVLDVDAEVLVTRGAGPDVGLAGLFAKLAGRRFVYSSANVSDFAVGADAGLPGLLTKFFGRFAYSNVNASEFDFSRLSPKLRDRALFRLGIRLADELVVQTTEQVRLCRESFGRSPVLIKSIAEPAAQRSHDPEAFLWIGRLVSHKRPLEFVELARSLPDAKFWMVAVPAPRADGAQALATALEESAAKVPNLELLAPRPRRELMDLTGRAVAVVNTADFEGMPNIFLEGWARGVPALALTHDPDEVIERHDLGGYAHGSSERLVELASRLWEERWDQTGVAARCRRYIDEHHSAEAVSARWQEALGIGATERAAGTVLAR
jgi:glycosyltransferase involved in cell wall biosynthesis